MNSQDGNTRDESQMRRPELRLRLQDAWKRIDNLEAENEQLREALQEAYRLVDTYYADMTNEASDELEQHLISALDAGGGGDE